MADEAVSWIQTEPLIEVVARVRQAVRDDVSVLDGVMAAALARRLIDAEVAPGGPYKDGAGRVGLSLNTRIAALFRQLGTPLAGVEAYIASRSPETTARSDERRHVAPRYVLTPIQRRAKLIIGAYREPLRAQALRRYRSILTVDSRGEISTIAELFGVSLTKPAPCDYDMLGLANLFVWLAYSIYDDIIDNEGTTEALPAANAAHRDALNYFLNAAPVKNDMVCFAVFQAMDEANAWELKHCRFAVADGVITIGRLPRYGSYKLLARRAGAHILGPLLIAYTAQFSGEQNDTVRQALDDYLIARQLNDDLHDWKEDFRRGHISPVVARLIGMAQLEGTVPVDQAVEMMQRAFWESGLQAMSVTALSAIKRAQSRLVAQGIVKADSYFISRVLHPIQVSLEKGLRRHANDKLFFETYRKDLLL